MNRLIGSALIASILTFAGPATTALPLTNSEPTGRSPHGHSAIVFISDRDSPSEEDVIDDVYLYDTTTRQTSRLTNDNRAEQFPAISPDGRFLSYIVVGGGIEVCALRYAGTRWSCGPARGVVSYPVPSGRFAWTPNSRAIVYSGTVSGETDSDLYLLNVYTLRPPRNLTQEAPGQPAVTEFQPAVSPDGRSIAYTVAGDLYQRRIDGSAPVQLTATPNAIEFGVAYSPDGTRIAFHSNRRAPGDFDIYVMRPVAESPRNPAVDLTDEVTAADGSPSRERFPTWSPDGRAIAFWWHLTAQGLEDGELFVMSAEGTTIRNITDNNPADATGRPIGDIYPNWGAPLGRSR